MGGYRDASKTDFWKTETELASVVVTSIGQVLDQFSPSMACLHGETTRNKILDCVVPL